MGQKSKIAWTDDTFNPWWGCVEISPGCDNCYAKKWDARWGESHWGVEAPRKFFGDKHWREPIKWNRQAREAGKRRRVFCASMADVFEQLIYNGEDAFAKERPRLWQLVRDTPWLDWLLLTKRPQNIARLLPADLQGAHNVWLGTTLESPDYLWRVDKLRQTKAVVHFLSMEPLVGMVSEAQLAEALNAPQIDGHTIDWVITGCESGENARYTPLDHYREILRACTMAGVARFLKQTPRMIVDPERPADSNAITVGPGSWTKIATPAAVREGFWLNGIVEQPYLDGKQYIEFPRAA